MLVKPSTILTLRWHYDFCAAKIGMPQKGLKREDGVWGRREKVSSKVFPFFPDYKTPLIGNRALQKTEGRITAIPPEAATLPSGV